MVLTSPLAWFLKWENEIPNEIFLRQPIGEVWKTWTWAQAGEAARKIAQGFRSLQLPAGSHIAILSKNCAEWILSDLAIMMAGCVSIPLYPTLSAAFIRPILEHSDARAIILGKLDDYHAQKDGIPEQLLKISVAAYGIQADHAIENFIQQQQPLTSIYSWQQDDLLTIIYTSGTTGNSKGVMHRVGAFDSVLKVAMKDLQLPLRPHLFSYLPLSHIAERIGIEINGFYHGATISFAESLDSFARNLADVQPHVFFAVPRIWEKFKEKILDKIPQQKLHLLLSLPVIGRFVKRKIRKNLGLSRATHIYSAAAPLSVDHLLWFDKLGISICQAYGMTEDCVYSHFCSPQQNRFGSVGKALSGLKVKITADGEIRGKSPGNMIGYYKEPVMTKDSFDEEGYLKTGDIGTYDQDGYLFITGRVKDIFKTDKGKYISPAPIELKIRSNADVEQVCVVGTGVPQPMALVTLSEMARKKTKEELVHTFSGLLHHINSVLEKFEQLEKIVIMKGNWTQANGLLTPTLKLKRNEIEKIYLPYYPLWFQEKDPVIWEM